MLQIKKNKYCKNVNKSATVINIIIITGTNILF